MMANNSQNHGDFWCNTAQPEYVAHAAIHAMMTEASKGCDGTVYSYPLAGITPQFDHFDYRDCAGTDPLLLAHPKFFNGREDLSILVPYFHEQDGNAWHDRVFDVLAPMHSIRQTFFHEIIGLKDLLQIQFCIPRSSTELFQNSFKSGFRNTEIKLAKSDILRTALKGREEGDIEITSFCPSPPYWRNLFAPDPSGTSHFYSLFQSLRLEQNEFFYYRLAIEAAQEGWAHNCLNLHTHERRAAHLFPEINSAQKWYVPPSAESKAAINAKLHPENAPFFFVQPMIVFSGSKAKFKSIRAFFDNYRFGDQPYNTIGTRSYRRKLGKEIKRFLKKRMLHVQGHLLNRYETAFHIGIPCKTSIQNREFPFPRISTKPIPPELQRNGIVLGQQSFLDERINLCMPFRCLENSLFLDGDQGFGKTNLLLNILVQIAALQNPTYSIIVFYFHDFEFVSSFISGLPERRLKDVILAMPFLNGKIPAKNLVDGTMAKDPSGKASDLAYALENTSTTLGINIRYVINCAMEILVLASNTAFDHVLNVLQKDDPIGRIIRREAWRKTGNPLLRRFIEELEKRTEDSDSIRNKFREFFAHSKIAGMCAYTGVDRLPYREIVEGKKILIWYLGGTKSGGNAIASMEMSQLHNHFLDYGTSFPRPVFPTIIAADEVQRVKARGFADSIREDRKHGLSYIISTQAMSGVDPALKEGIGLVGNLAFFQCPDHDARFFSGKSGGIITPNDIMALTNYEMYLRIMSSKHVYKCSTIKFQEGDNRKLDFVIKNCLNRYYVDPQEQAELKKQWEMNLLQGGRPRKPVSKLKNLPAGLLKIANKGGNHAE